MGSDALVARELPDDAPFWDRAVSLAMVVDGQLMASHAVGGKHELLSMAGRATAIVATWHGTYYSDLFSVSAARLKIEAAKKGHR